MLNLCLNGPQNLISHALKSCKCYELLLPIEWFPSNHSNIKIESLMENCRGCCPSCSLCSWELFYKRFYTINLLIMLFGFHRLIFVLTCSDSCWARYIQRFACLSQLCLAYIFATIKVNRSIAPQFIHERSQDVDFPSFCKEILKTCLHFVIMGCYVSWNMK